MGVANVYNWNQTHSCVQIRNSSISVPLLAENCPTERGIIIIARLVGNSMRICANKSQNVARYANAFQMRWLRVSRVPGYLVRSCCVILAIQLRMQMQLHGICGRMCEMAPRMMMKMYICIIAKWTQNKCTSDNQLLSLWRCVSFCVCRVALF